MLAGPRTAPGSPCLSCGGFLGALFSPLLEGEGLVPLPQPLRFGVKALRPAEPCWSFSDRVQPCPKPVVGALKECLGPKRRRHTLRSPPNPCSSSLAISWKPLGCLGAPGRAQPQHRAAVEHSPCWSIAPDWLPSPAACHLPPNPLPRAQEWVRAPPAWVSAPWGAPRQAVQAAGAEPAPYRPFLHPARCPAVQHGHLPCLILIISATGQP